MLEDLKELKKSINKDLKKMKRWVETLISTIEDVDDFQDEEEQQNIITITKSISKRATQVRQKIFKDGISFEGCPSSRSAINEYYSMEEENSSHTISTPLADISDFNILGLTNFKENNTLKSKYSGPGSELAIKNADLMEENQSLKLENQILRNEVIEFQRNDLKIKEENLRYCDQNQELAKANEELRDQLKEIEAKFEGVSDLLSTTKSVKERLEIDQEDLASKNTLLMTENQTFKEELISNRVSLKKLEEDNENLSRSNMVMKETSADMENQLMSLKKENEEYVDLLKKIMKQKGKIINEYEKLKNTAKELGTAPQSPETSKNGERMGSPVEHAPSLVMKENTCPQKKMGGMVGEFGFEVAANEKVTQIELDSPSLSTLSLKSNDSYLMTFYGHGLSVVDYGKEIFKSTPLFSKLH